MSAIETRQFVFAAIVLLLQPPHLTLAQNRTTFEQQIQNTFTALQEIDVEAGEVDVPPSVRSLLPIFKHQLRDLFILVLDQSKDGGAAELKGLFENAITDAGLKVGDPPEGTVHPYGALTQVDVQLVQNKLIVTTTLSVACGSDTSLYVFERSAGDWRRTLDFESNGYKDIAGARGSFDWKIGGGTARTPWFLVATDVNPWCTSNWQQLRWVVLRPGPQDDRPDVVQQGNAVVYLARDEPYRITADQHGFRLVWWGEEQLDVGLLIRPHVANFTVIGNVVQRVHPVAFRPDDFIDEWAYAPWRESEKWTRTDARRSARTWHAVLTKPSAGTSYLTAFEFVQPCRQQMTWQVALGFEPIVGLKRLPHGIPERLFFLVDQRKSRFEVVNVGTMPFACPARTPPPPRPNDLPK